MSVSDAAQARSPRGRFWRIVGAGAAFQEGAAAIDSATVVASLVFQPTGNAFAVGFASAMLRLGWLLPQLVVGFLAERAPRRMPFYVFGAYGRALLAGLIALTVWFAAHWPAAVLATVFLGLWTHYALSAVGGRALQRHRRPLDPLRRARPDAGMGFFGGGILALCVAAFERRTLDVLLDLQAYALIFGWAVRR